MLTKTKKRIEHLNIILLMCMFILVGASCVHAEESSVDKALHLKLKIGNFRMHLGLELNKSVLQKMAAKDSTDRIVELGNWPQAPLVVVSSIANGEIRIRFEDDFITIWYHSPVSLVDGKSTPLDVVRDAINDILGEALVIGEDDILVIDEGVVISSGKPSPFGNTKAELVTTSLPKEIPGTGAIAFGYGDIKGKRNWGLLIDGVNVLVKDKDAIIVMGKLKARTYQKLIHEGLIAAKARLTKEEAEKAKSKPILARNVIFGKEIDTKDVPDILLNGCMWPVDNEIVVGVKDVGSANKLGEIKAGN